MIPPDPKPPKILVWLVLIAVINAAVLLLILLPIEPAAGLFVLVVIGLMLAAARRARLNLRALFTVMRRRLIGTAPVMQPIPMRRGLVEIALVAVAALVVAGQGHYLEQPGLRLRGWEAEWLTSPAYFAAQSLREYGYIPKWQPFLEFGEPLITNPFSFVANPVSIGPSLIFGGLRGIAISITLYAILAGVGGWFLGRMLGLGALGRVLLALLLLGKGNMHAMIGTGYYQLGVAQAYFPWIIGGALAVIWLPGKRWPVALLAMMSALLFTAGNIWYTLLPIWVERGHIGGHPDEIEAGAAVNPADLLPAFFDGDMRRGLEITTHTGGVYVPMSGVAQFYYSFVVPGWFAMVLLVLIPPIWPLLHRPGQGGTQGIWWVGGFLIVLAALWGLGGQPLFVWLYAHVPFLGQWRFVGRALALASFWIAVLVALRLDGLWRALTYRPDPSTQPVVLRMLRRMLRRTIAGALIIASGIAAYQVNANWGWVPFFVPRTYYDDICIDWLRQHNPDRPLAVFRGGYDSVTTYIQNHVRLFNIEADYTPLPLEWTLGHIDLTGYASLPEYAVAWEDNERLFLIGEGYAPVLGSRLVEVDHHCLWRRARALSYAYTVPLARLSLLDGSAMPADETTPVSTLARRPDEIGLIVRADPQTPLALTVQERAYPGWWVELDGQPARLESVGGQIGVVLPLDDRLHTVYFAFRPPLLYLGGGLTLLTCCGCAAYLLRLDRRKIRC